jgi:hypothetical protein
MENGSKIVVGIPTNVCGIELGGSSAAIQRLG